MKLREGSLTAHSSSTHIFLQLVTLHDPVSRWMFAESVPVGCDNIPRFIATFMFKTFCCFGFPKVELYNFNSIQFEMILVEYHEMLELAGDVIPDLKTLQGDIILKSTDDTFPDQDITNHLINPNDVSTSIWLLNSRLQQNEAGLSPFQMIFSRRVVERTNPGVDVKQTRRKLQSSVLHCRHCDESFTSKISFRIHQRRHTEEARLRGQREGEAPLKKIEEEEDENVENKESSSPVAKKTPLRKVGYGRNKLQKRRRLAKLAEKWSHGGAGLDEDVKEEVSEHAAEAVRALLQATRDERHRRGKYLRYSPELRDEIAEYALAHGQTAAAQLYSEKLNMVVAESSVRNFVRVHQNFPKQLRLEIGEYAGQHGLEVTSKFYSGKLGLEVSRGMVRRFRKQYCEAAGGAGPGGGQQALGGGGQVYSQELREEIGRYAAVHGVEAAVQVYSDKLLHAVRPSTVRKFRQLYGEAGEQLGCIQLSESSSTTIDLLHSSLDVLNQHSATYLPSYSSGQNVFLAHSYPQEKIDNSLADGSSPSTSNLNQKTPTSDNKTKKAVKKTSKKMTRGRYVQYSDELRAKIGKFALKHGNSAAMKHFYAELGHEIPESTIRGMRDKYQLLVERGAAAETGEVEAVGCGPRGRPTSLGPALDSLVQEAVRSVAA